MSFTDRKYQLFVECKYCGSSITEPLIHTRIDERNIPDQTKHLCKICGMIFFIDIENRPMSHLS